MYTTDSPCFNCSHLIINSGIIEVRYKREYRDLVPIGWLNLAGVKTEIYNEPLRS
jgi:deoxycytidylate deaminase